MWTPLAKRRPVGRGRAAADQVDRGRALDSRGDLARDRRGGLIEGPDGAAERVEQAAAGFDDHGWREDLRSGSPGRTRPDGRPGCRTSIGLSQRCVIRVDE